MENLKITDIFRNFNYFYLFVVLIYSVRAVRFTANLEFFSGDILGFVIPIVLTIAVIVKNKIQLIDKKFLSVVILYAIWTVAQYFKYGSLDVILSLYVFYQLLVGYCLFICIGKDIFKVYEFIIYKLSIICLVVWILNILMPSIVSEICEMFAFKPNGIIKYNFIVASVLNLDYYENSFRNPGFCWEPGVYACYLVLAIFFNLVRTNFTIKGNKILYFLTFCLVTTFSTTGISTLFASVVLFYMYNQKGFKKIVAWVIVIPLSIYVFSLDFMGDKILELQTQEGYVEQLSYNMDYNDSQGATNIVTPQRFDGMFLENLNLNEDPILGYGVDHHHSWVAENISERIALSNGIIKIYAKYGLILGILLTILIYLGSKHISIILNFKGPIFLFLLYELISVSYDFINKPFFLTLFVFYGIDYFFNKKEIKDKILLQEKDEY